MLKKAFCCVAIVLASSFAHAQESSQWLGNWPQFRGPLATGVAPQGNPPTEWSAEKNIKWKVAIPGKGSASPIIWGDRIFVLSAIKTDRTADSDTAATADDSVFRFVSDGIESHGTHAALLAQNDGRGRGEGERGGRGGRGRGGFGGGGGRFGGGEPPTNYYQFVVHCLDRNSGEKLWQKVATEAIPHEGHHGTGSFASSSPVTD